MTTKQKKEHADAMHVRLMFPPLGLRFNGQHPSIVNVHLRITHCEIRKIAPGKFQPFIGGQPWEGLFNGWGEPRTEWWPTRMEAITAIVTQKSLQTLTFQLPTPPKPKPSSLVNDYASAVAFMAHYPRRVLCNQTWLEWRGDDVAVRFHATDVVTFCKDGSIVVGTGGWRTLNTWDRIKDYLPSGYSREGKIDTRRSTGWEEWRLVNDKTHQAIPMDGCRILPSGHMERT